MHSGDGKIKLVFHNSYQLSVISYQFKEGYDVVKIFY